MLAVSYAAWFLPAAIRRSHIASYHELSRIFRKKFFRMEQMEKEGRSARKGEEKIDILTVQLWWRSMGEKSSPPENFLQQLFFF
jgi:hypothetical protein